MGRHTRDRGPTKTITEASTRIGLRSFEAGLPVGKIVIFTLLLRHEAPEPLDASFGIASASIKRGDPARIVGGVFQLIRRDCPVSVAFAACGRNASLIEYDLLMTLAGKYR